MMRAPNSDQIPLKKGTWSPEEDHKLIAYINRYGIWNWTEMPKAAARLPGRTDNEIKNYWHSHLKKHLKKNNVVHETKSPEKQTTKFQTPRTNTSETDVSFSSTSAPEASTSGSSNGISNAAGGNSSSNSNNNLVITELGKNLQATVEVNTSLSDLPREVQSWKGQPLSTEDLQILENYEEMDHNLCGWKSAFIQMLHRMIVEIIFG
ncbi:hypothetical protein GH714_001367 [Hevea brasiliensis]|uniref:Uncharacterized protein n=1 Tax=Hevea brasiliensis TaxID=3981 RepID=A0A6A6LZC6_HEVBR|nr:hypothetical protein GH714_001367 [Hevea brasiliensis]